MLISRLAYIQVLRRDDFYQKATNQWFKEIPIGVARGKIFDRNMKPLTNKQKTQYLVIFPELFQKTEQNLEIIAKLTGVKTYMLRYEKITGLRPVQLKVLDDQVSLLKKAVGIRGVYPVEAEDRYAETGLASHIIGYINKIDNTGHQGLEKNFDEVLKENQDFKIGAIVDAQKRMIPGLGYKIIQENTPDKRKSIVTTLDAAIQQIAEEEFDRSHHKGSVVVLDIQSGDVIAMVSRPNYNQDDVAASLNSNNLELFNRAIQIPYPPGSVFKMVVAAAALENHLISLSDTFFCSGAEEIGDVVIRCSSYERGGHGQINLENAFSLSCNSYFIQLGRLVGGKEILSMAEKMGLGHKTGIELPEEIAGTLPDGDYIKGAGIGNISIGQGTLEVTPLQIARLTAIIANDGVDNGVHLIRHIVDEYGNILEDYSKTNAQRVLSPDTATQLQHMMQKVVAEGTARNSDMTAAIDAAGKTGSAEAVSDRKNTVHAWFTGYFPSKNPRYAITVVVEDGGSGGRIAAPTFKNIARRINILENESN
ncbi:hypothetical protein Gferi_26925 [Geosporobacter ferrireducens]|uniref:Penicillin-binding protein transpeptidase domain-containing protein n=2 Tax=Geosporobacter ferrireducens TaxID=1424294 RepID=A0A1D8GR02_9FIRM|nr:hypothetical protein Gferi_26925 [Geosporobacter ferrireducens]